MTAYIPLARCETVEANANVAHRRLLLCAEEVLDVTAASGELHTATNSRQWATGYYSCCDAGPVFESKHQLASELTAAASAE